jgi:hypothetical protein
MDHSGLVLRSNQSERSKDESSNRNHPTSELSFTNNQTTSLIGKKRRRGRPSLAKHQQDDEDSENYEEPIHKIKPTPIYTKEIQNSAPISSD